jgi:hypothetical protein
MPLDNCTLTHAKIKGFGYSLRNAEWIAHLIILDLVFIAAVTGVLVVLIQALWECIHRPMIARAGSWLESRLPSGRGLRH